MMQHDGQLFGRLHTTHSTQEQQEMSTSPPAGQSFARVLVVFCCCLTLSVLMKILPSRSCVMLG